MGSNHSSTIYGDDGSVAITFAHDALERVNWIPVPTGEFWLIIRFYAPEPEVLSVDYEISGIASSTDQVPSRISALWCQGRVMEQDLET